MLRSLNLPRFAELINDAVINVYKDGTGLTNDLGGKSGTKKFTKLVTDEIERLDVKSTKKV